jgi:cobalt-zinc-cadmium efflux system outer membrane protein
MKLRAAILSVALALGGLIASESLARAEGNMSMEDAVSIALQRNRDVLATKLDIEASELDRVAAGVYWNPQFSYTAGNLVLGTGNPQDKGLSPGLTSQIVHQASISEVIDVWAKRSARIRAADKGIEHRKLVVEDALREIVHTVRTAFADLVREQLEHELTITMKTRYDETIRISGARFRAGEISEAEFGKIQLEGLKYQNALIDADLELELAREHLAAMLGLGSAAGLPGTASMTNDTRVPLSAQALATHALQDRPDLRAARQGHDLSEANIDAAKREAYPDLSLGVTYTHSEFQVSGDNPNALALTLSLPLPIFDRNQANIGRARVDSKRFENDVARLELQVQHEVVDAVHRVDRSATLLDVYEKGMLDRADRALKVAETSYKAGSSSLIELLEAQRTYIDTRAQYLRAQHDYRQAVIDVTYATHRRAQ